MVQEYPRRTLARGFISTQLGSARETRCSLAAAGQGMRYDDGIAADEFFAFSGARLWLGGDRVKSFGWLSIVEGMAFRARRPKHYYLCPHLCSFSFSSLTAAPRLGPSSRGRGLCSLALQPENWVVLEGTMEATCSVLQPCTCAVATGSPFRQRPSCVVAIREITA